MGYLEDRNTPVARGRSTTAKHVFLSTYQMAKLCKRDERTIRRWVANGRLKAVWIVDPLHCAKGRRAGRWGIDPVYGRKFAKYSLMHNLFEIGKLNREFEEDNVRGGYEYTS